jgi:hypothetical protein
VFYTIYKTTNKINGKIYIGKHQTKNLDDDYIGSGKHLWNAIKKHGIENFEKEILFVFDNEPEMNAKEAELVTEKFVLENTNYNICPGGQGGFGYINNYVLTNEDRVKAGSIGGKVISQKWAEKRRLNPKPPGPGKGCRLSGKDSPTYGKIWITNEKENKKNYPNEPIQEGWRIGGRIKQIRKSDIKREKLLEEKNKEIQKYQQIWEDVIRNGLSLNQASKVYGITKQILMRRFSKMHPEEYKLIFSSKRTSK